MLKCARKCLILPAECSPQKSPILLEILRQNLSKPTGGVNNRNVIITQQFHAAPDQANRDFLLEY